MKIFWRDFYSNALRNVILALCLLAGAQHAAWAEPPTILLRPFEQGWIAIDWEHPDDGVSAISVERGEPRLYVEF